MRSENGQRPKVSVIVPVYNAERYLDFCIKSILAQDFGDFEVVLIDDGSTDGSGAILEQYQDNSRVKIITQKNAGVSAARNVGIRNSQGEYIMFVDADDYIDTMMLRELYGASENGECDLVISRIGEKNAEVVGFEDDLVGFLVCNELWSPCARLIKRKTIEYGFDTEIAVAEDLWFCYQNCKNWKKYAYIPKKMYHYRSNRESVMRKNRVEKRDLTVFEVLERMINDDTIDMRVKIFLKTYYVKTYYFVFSKKVSSDIMELKKKYKKMAELYYKDIKKCGRVGRKIFIQAKMTPLYNLLRRVKGAV